MTIVGILNCLIDHEATRSTLPVQTPSDNPVRLTYVILLHPVLMHGSLYLSLESDIRVVLLFVVFISNGRGAAHSEYI